MFFQPAGHYSGQKCSHGKLTINRFLILPKVELSGAIGPGHTAIELKGKQMRIKRVIGAAGIISLILAGIGSYCFAGDQATPGEIVQKVKDAVSFLEKSKGANLADFNNPKGPWVFSGAYVYVQDCGKGTMAAHPFAPQLVGKNVAGLQDVKGNFLTAQICAEGKKAGGGWTEYWFPKPGEKTPSHKFSYALQAPGTSLVATAGMYSDTLKVSDLDNQLKK